MKIPPLWHAVIWTPSGNRKLRTCAFTKSEARAGFKRLLGIPRKGRLPALTEVLRAP